MAPITPSPCAIVHYHEISLKRGNRPLFLRHLQQNIRRAIGDLGPARLVQLSGRIMLDLTGHPDPAAVRDRLGRVAGVANIALAERTGSQMDALKAAVERAIAGRVVPLVPHHRAPGLQDVSAHLGRDQSRARRPRPGAPTRRARGPLSRRAGRARRGAAGRGLRLLGAERRAGRPAHRLGRHGGRAALGRHRLAGGGVADDEARVPRRLRPLPQRALSARHLPAQGAAARRAPHPVAVRLAPVPGPVRRDPARGRPVGPAARADHDLPAPHGAHRRARSRGDAAPWRSSPGTAWGRSPRRPCTTSRASTPRRNCPSCGRSSAWTSSRSPRRREAIDTFEISIEPDADCCTLFVPRHPGTRMSLEEAAAVERRLDVPALVAMGVDGAVEEPFDFPAGAGAFPPHAPRSRSREKPVPE